jgi:hypothetical protein
MFLHTGDLVEKRHTLQSGLGEGDSDFKTLGHTGLAVHVGLTDLCSKLYQCFLGMLMSSDIEQNSQHTIKVGLSSGEAYRVV